MDDKTHQYVEKLAENILYHKRMYYKGQYVISDSDFDLLEEKLRLLSPDHPVLSLVGDKKKIDSGNKVTHQVPMLSLAKTYSLKELFVWKKERILVGSYKIDGNSISLIYENGHLSLAKTRGDGFVGENVTEKIRWIKECVPNLSNLDIQSKTIEVRGEVYCSQEKFSTLLAEMKDLGLEAPTNPRNTVAGILGRKHYFELARYFSFFAFDVLVKEDLTSFTNEWDKIQWLENKGFKTPGALLLKDQSSTETFLDQVQKKMGSLSYGIDGAVFTYNDLKLQKKLGSTSHHPRYKMSFKWQGETATSTIESIVWSTSRLGIVTPVAKISAISLSGAKITNVTLHNEYHVRSFNLKVNDTIEIVRSGEVIPKFLRVVKSDSGSCEVPQKCSSCQSTLKSDGIRLICLNSKECSSQIMLQILNWIKAAKIDDLSEKRLLALMEKNLVSSSSDLYKLTAEDILTLGKTKEKLAHKLYNSIQKSKAIEILDFLVGLGVQGVGRVTWGEVVKVFGTVSVLQKATAEDLIKINGLAEKTSQSIVDGLKQRKTEIEKLFAVGVQIVEKNFSTKKSSNIFTNKKFVLTGAMKVPRKKLIDAITVLDGRVQNTVSKETSCLIVADPSALSTKTKKAKDLGVEIWSENRLIEELEKLGF